MPFRSQNVWSKTSRMLNPFGGKGGASKEVMRRGFVSSLCHADKTGSFQGVRWACV